MSLTLKSLCSANDNHFKITLRAGLNGFRNAVTWVHMVEDDYIIPSFRGSELAVTRGIKMTSDPSWLSRLVQELSERGVAGLIVNTGRYIPNIPQEILDYCDEREFPLLTMPWEIAVTEMLQTFCTRIIQEQHDSILFDKALDDALLKRGNEEEYSEILGRYYDLQGRFTVFLINPGLTDEETKRGSETEYRLINSLRRFKMIHGMKAAKFGILTHEKTHLVVTNNVEKGRMPELLELILSVYSEQARAKTLFVGVGNEVTGLENINKSYSRARTAMRMAVYRKVPYIRFEDMGFYKVLFSVKDEELLYAYADEVLAPIEGEDGRHQGYMELLKAYIENDRSLERTAQALYLHRNTVNYRIQKMKTLLDSPLKTVEELFPYQVALAIRDIRLHSQGNRESSAD